MVAIDRAKVTVFSLLVHIPYALCTANAIGPNPWCHLVPYLFGGENLNFAISSMGLSDGWYLAKVLGSLSRGYKRNQ